MGNKLVIYYSIENCGDGSAYPRMFDSEELAAWHREHLYEGWGKDCVGEITVEGDNLSCPELQTKEGHYLTLLEDEDEDGQIAAFVAKFFPDGLPKFTVEIIKPHYYGVFVEGRLVHEQFAYPEKKANKEGVTNLTKVVNK